jgi:molybdopterin/thiamine biosynthesis adenylyltransferase
LDHTRHIGIYNAADCSVTLIGAGGIGAVTGLVLAKMGIGWMVVYDDDVVSPVNLATQFYPMHSLGGLKSLELRRLVWDFSDDVEISGGAQRWDATFLAQTGIVISAVDSIRSRKSIWESLRSDGAWGWYIDARMGAEVFQASIVKRGDWQWYDANLAAQDDSQIPDDPCTSKATIYTGALAAGHIGWIVRRIITGDPLPKKIVHDLNAINLLAL